MSTAQQRQELEQLKRSVGRGPFDARVKFTADYCACPFHQSETQKSMHLEKKSDGAYIATCFSECAKSWNTIDFVMAFDKLDFRGALDKLRGKSATDVPGQTTTGEKLKPKRMTEAEWQKWGRPVTPDDITQFAASRKDYTASFETWRNLDCRVKDGWIGFPYKYTDRDNEIAFDLIKKRPLDRKDFDMENAAATNGLFNLDSVNILEGGDAFVLEGEPDVCTMIDAGYTTSVSPTTGGQKKFSAYAISTLSCATRIFLIGDQAVGDETTGPKCMDTLQKLLPLYKTYRVRFDDAKDVSELRRKCGNVENLRARIQELIEDSLEPWVSKNIPNVCDLSTDDVKWTVDRMFPYGGLSIVCGKQGAMKSLSALFFADAATKNGERSFLGRAILEKTPILYIDRENSEGEAGRRAKKIGILAEQGIHYWGDWMHREPTPKPDDVRLFEFAERSKGLIVFDSLQDWYDGRNENSNTDMMELMRQFQKLARVGAGVLVLHHDSKFGEEGYRGATSITAVPEMCFSAKKNTEKDLIELREIRFRCTQSYEIDFRVNFANSSEQPDCIAFEPDYSIELLRDQLTHEVISEKKAAKRSKSDAMAEENSKIVALIEQDSTTKPGQIATEVGHENDNSGRLYVTRRAKMCGYEWGTNSQGNRAWQAIVKLDLSQKSATDDSKIY